VKLYPEVMLQELTDKLSEADIVWKHGIDKGKNVK
jgi:hypothetical protein